MQRVGLILLGMVSLVASGVIMDRSRVGLNAMNVLGLQTTQGIRDAFGGAGNVLTKDELLRQKFILDILQQIYTPLKQKDLLMLDDRSIITNEDCYMRPLTQEMQMVLDLINTNQMISKQVVCSINNDYHMKQAVGFYRLLVTARDFDTFQRLVVYGRQNVNTEMFVYTLVLALGERRDTQMLIVPALHEILPQLFIKDEIIDRVLRLDTGVSSLRPQITDVMGMGPRHPLFSRFADQQQEEQQGGLFNILTKSQLWMPWRELHKQIALRKAIGGNVVQQDQTVISLPGDGLLSQDISLKSYIGLFFDELVLHRDTVRNTNRQINYGGISGNRGINDYNTNSQYDSIVGGRLYDDEQGKRFRDNRWGETDEINRNIYGGVRQGMDIDMDVNRNRDFVARERFGRLNKNRFDIDEERDIGSNIYMGRNNNVEEVQRGINTVSANDARLLFLGRRRQNPNTVTTMGRNRYYEDDLISGGRKVVKDDVYDKRQKSETLNKNRDINGGRFGLDIDIDDAMDRNRVKIGARRFDNVEDENNSLLGGRLFNKNRFDIDEERTMGANMGRYNNAQEVQRGINTVSGSDARLLYVNRRRENPNSAITMTGNRYEEDDLISGGRKVEKEDINDKRQKSKYNDYNDDMNDKRQKGKYNDYNDDMNDKRQKGKYNDYNDERRFTKYYNDNDDDLTVDYTKRMNNERYINNDEYIRSYEDNDYWNRNYGSRRVDIPVGNTRDNFLSMLTGGRVGQRQYMQNDEDSMYNRGWTNQYNRERLDENLPTTNINDERLLYINPRKLNNFEQDRYINKNEGGIYEDVNDRYNTGYLRGNMNMQRSYLDDQTNWDTTRRGNQYGQSGIYDNDSVNYRAEKVGRRSRRSIVNQEQDQYLGQKNTINGRLVLHTLQQLVARLNIERIALGQPQLIENTQNNMGRGILTNNLVASTGYNGIDVQTVNEIERILQQIDNALQQRIGQITVASYNQKVNEIGLILAGQIEGLGLAEILGDVLQQTNQQQGKRLDSNLLESKAAQILLAGIVKVVDQKVQQVFRQREEFISNVYGVNINAVEVDTLQTYVEQTNIDLSNLLNNNNINTDQTIQGNKKVVLGRTARLNHKNFNVKIDVTSDRQQQVVVRNLLVPKIDGQNNIIPLTERRENVIVLDITTVELQQGRNSLKLKSQDITITSRDTTPLTKIYQLVMQALNGDITLQQNVLNGQSTLLPHHLLLPRGRTNGLPMQLITVITPLQRSSGIIGVQQGNPLNTLLLDNLPLNYPLHCDITDVEKLISMPNLNVKDVLIYHEDNIQMPILY